jgi:hypothetical protein
MGSAIEKLWAVWDDPDDEFQQAYDDARIAVATFTFVRRSGSPGPEAAPTEGARTRGLTSLTRATRDFYAPIRPNILD